MSEWLTRATPAELEIRSDGRTVVGIAVPFDQAARVNDGHGPFDETFARGAFARTIAERPGRVKFLANHQRLQMPLGRVTLLREDQAGLYMEARVSQTAAGDDALELIRDGALDGLSVSFLPIRDDWSRDRRSVTRQEVRLHEVSAVAFPAYQSALIVAVRSPALPVGVARRRLALLKTRFR